MTTENPQFTPQQIELSFQKKVAERGLVVPENLPDFTPVAQALNASPSKSLAI